MKRVRKETEKILVRSVLCLLFRRTMTSTVVIACGFVARIHGEGEYKQSYAKEGRAKQETKRKDEGVCLLGLWQVTFGIAGRSSFCFSLHATFVHRDFITIPSTPELSPLGFRCSISMP